MPKELYLNLAQAISLILLATIKSDCQASLWISQTLLPRSLPDLGFRHLEPFKSKIKQARYIWGCPETSQLLSGASEEF